MMTKGQMSSMTYTRSWSLLGSNSRLETCLINAGNIYERACRDELMQTRLQLLGKHGHCRVSFTLKAIRFNAKYRYTEIKPMGSADFFGETHNIVGLSIFATNTDNALSILQFFTAAFSMTPKQAKIGETKN